MKHTIECAEAIGLDGEYLRKVAEQKRLREEVAKRKSQKRQENFSGISTTEEKSRVDSKRVKAPSPDVNSRRKRDDQKESVATRGTRRLGGSASSLKTKRNEQLVGHINERSKIAPNSRRRSGL